MVVCTAQQAARPATQHPDSASRYSPTGCTTIPPPYYKTAPIPMHNIIIGLSVFVRSKRYFYHTLIYDGRDITLIRSVLCFLSTRITVFDSELCQSASYGWSNWMDLCGRVSDQSLHVYDTQDTPPPTSPQWPVHTQCLLHGVRRLTCLCLHILIIQL